ncbi:pseudouridine-5'-phosphate glycosidase [Azospirillum sp. RWY-5-1]|uniref:Pseudouridine-5'-phosphate glycosidase n=1 Tax=Azospirillum oleiclasticum TaxID=2735135 RepID=A0ABX2T8L2_9PROT|nr:pseudouridine-5'-phosphate glycosidase [Azospirillum oleiclasticum]NYZ13505.1 pseudouridine-5'-phosphate glycosidase [Azospirillum oleiclasticum]NYZ20666.1 pseudouridine-5'-phosphate glycosidase [Azospirillum oleiclasticum]
MREHLFIHPEVADALAKRQPVVALESTVLTHGMPHPRNVETARRVEAAVREGGAVPATIAVLDGRIRVGLDDDDLQRLGEVGRKAWKLSRRDLPVALALGVEGSTTVAATMIGAELAGIPIFATGGIGGVHRGAELSFDVSADLEELARSSVCVVTAGAKAVLDLPKTLEVLETRGVPVLGFGTDRFPAFYTRDSGLPARRVDGAEEVARILHVKWRLGLDGGVVVANPIPEADALDPAVVGSAIDEALEQARAHGIAGGDVTPFLLERMEALTGGRSLEANVALIIHNARVGSAIARALCALQNSNTLPPKAPQQRPRY